MGLQTDNPLLQKIIDKFSSSRDFTISVVLHSILVVVFGTTALFQAVSEPPDFEGESGGFVAQSAAETAPPQQQMQAPQETTFEVATVAPQTSSPTQAITTTAPNPLNFAMNPVMTPQVTRAPETAVQSVAPSAPQNTMGRDGMTGEVAAQIRDFTGGWGKGSGSGTGVRQREFEFTAFIGHYAGGDWNSTVRVVRNKVVGGSLPNLLYIINKWSRDRIKTNEGNVRAIKLDSDEIFSIKPPFIFLTGTRDFRLTDKEVETLQRYVRMGGCIWGDSSLPGLRSRFDIAFRREMRRIIPDVDKQFEPLSDDHPIFTDGYFPEIRTVPPGLNYYQEPIFAMKIYGEIAILYTANDYGDMWQIGINEDGEIDMRRNERRQFVAINESIWKYRNTYLGNIDPPPPSRPGQDPVATNLVDTYKFGTNIIVHLLTRWDSVVSRAPSL